VKSNLQTAQKISMSARAEKSGMKAAAADGTFTNLEAVVSLDVGTARSGFAYAISNEHIKVEEEFDGLMVGCGKLPTVICTDRHGRFVSFGQQAIDKYFDPQSVVENLAIFINFKMLLYQHAAAKEWQREDALSTDTPPQPTRSQAPDRVMATSLDGKTQVRVLNLMSYTLLALVQHARRRLCRLGKSPSQSNVRWVITVPAICNSSVYMNSHANGRESGRQGSHARGRARRGFRGERESAPLVSGVGRGSARRTAGIWV
jgi:hypothetical protein